MVGGKMSRSGYTDEFYISHFVNDGDVVFDIGANIGRYIESLNKLKRYLHIYAFEPIIECFRKLMHITLSNENSLNIYNVALTNSLSNSTKFYSIGDGTPDDDYSLSSFSARDDVDGVNRQEIFVDIDTLDNFCKTNEVKHIDYIKMDVEGYEYYVLWGGRNVWPNVKYIQWEYGYGMAEKENGVNTKDLVNLFWDHAYKIYWANITDELKEITSAQQLIDLDNEEQSDYHIDNLISIKQE